MPARRCSRTGCVRPAAATLTYAYVDSTAVVGPLAAVVEPHSHDLCDPHAEALTVPLGWLVVRHEETPAGTGVAPPRPRPSDDLVALAEAVREATGRPSGARGGAAPAGEQPAGRAVPTPGRPSTPSAGTAAAAARPGGAPKVRGGHLRVVRPEPD